MLESPSANTWVQNPKARSNSFESWLSHQLAVWTDMCPSLASSAPRFSHLSNAGVGLPTEVCMASTGLSSPFPAAGARELAEPFKLKPCTSAELQTLDSAKGTPYAWDCSLCQGWTTQNQQLAQKSGATTASQLSPTGARRWESAVFGHWEGRGPLGNHLWWVCEGRSQEPPTHLLQMHLGTPKAW